jgi:hypothetical protein
MADAEEKAKAEKLAAAKKRVSVFFTGTNISDREVSYLG